jgi:hypothetical protein
VQLTFGSAVAASLNGVLINSPDSLAVWGGAGGGRASGW